jgi:hypothetical protein
MRRTLCCLACLLASAVVLPGAPGNDTKAVLARARQYVADYDRALIAVVADEHYVQSSGSLEADDITGDRERVLDSQFAWIHLPALQETIGVRDVLRVDGQAVADGSRLHALLERPQQDVSQEIRAILAESARHNIGALERNFNFPTFPLVYLRRSDDSRTRWRADSNGVASTLRFDERQHSTVVRTIDGAPTRASGQFSVDAASGRVLRCDIRLELPPPRRSPGEEYRIRVEFAYDGRIDLWVPVLMIEQVGRTRGSAPEHVGVVGEATYGNYRRYQTAGRVLPR